MFATHYKYKHPITKTPPKNLVDVLEIIKDKEWYNHKKSFTINSLHMILYGIFRRHLDDWVNKLEHGWNNSRNITTYSVTRYHQGTSFVYSNLISRASVKIQTKIRKVMWQFHQEEITCRPKSIEVSRNLVQTKMKCNNCVTYFYTLPQIDDDITKEKLLKKIQSSML